jgi:hypothetical protein
MLLISGLSIKPKQTYKKCFHCKYYIPNQHVNDVVFGKCLYNPVKLDKVYNLISGELIEDNSEYEYCTTARHYNYLCGPDAKNYITKK